MSLMWSLCRWTMNGLGRDDALMLETMSLCLVANAHEQARFDTSYPQSFESVEPYL